LRLVIGDRVQLSDYGQGEVKFIGPVLFAEGIWYGVQLDANKGKNNGIVDKRKYFECKTNHGILVNETKITSLISNGKNIRIGIGDRVEIPKKGIGTVRFIGSVEFNKGIWYGIELDEKKGQNDGTVNQIRYFKCRNHCGIFIKEEELSNIQKEKRRRRGR